MGNHKRNRSSFEHGKNDDHICYTRCEICCDAYRMKEYPLFKMKT
ncbi:hypothetical protein AWRI1631_47190 [Saccharomyces cerevisiae AWRI1631]|uniref:Uncharacterized protein n=1 Tax=Saccharomyces cerevisiae (strain AWRI1631) TaxID=545124 RepID=B5VH27_YEAS6|nr:hypothetical protein AWRI1631_47190 [Saccharomyces cerevisiae AWRI1631]